MVGEARTYYHMKGAEMIDVTVTEVMKIKEFGFS